MRIEIDDLGQQLEVRVPAPGFGCGPLIALLYFGGVTVMFGAYMVARNTPPPPTTMQWISPSPRFPPPQPAAPIPPMDPVGSLILLCGACAFIYLAYLVVTRSTTSLVIRVNATDIVVETTCMGSSDSQEFATSDIQDLRVVTIVTRTKNGRHVSRVLGFDYGGRTQRFAAGLDEAECRAVLRSISAKFPHISVQM